MFFILSTFNTLDVSENKIAEEKICASQEIALKIIRVKYAWSHIPITLMCPSARVSLMSTYHKLMVILKIENAILYWSKAVMLKNRFIPCTIITIGTAENFVTYLYKYIYSCLHFSYHRSSRLNLFFFIA